MEKLTDEMELEDWEILSDDGLLDFHSHEDLGKGMLVPTKLDFNPKGVFDTYFKYPLPDSPRVLLDHKSLGEEVVKEVIEVPMLSINKELLGEDQEDMVSQQVFFNRMKKNQFVDIKMDSPESGMDTTMEIKASAKEGIAKDDSVQEKKSTMVDAGSKEVTKWKAKNGGFCIWKWRITGIGALCSLGMAAASIFIFILGSQSRNKQQQQNQKVQFQIYTDDKRFKQVVHHATKLNQAISSVRGGPFNSAHFTYGGYYVCESGA